MSTNPDGHSDSSMQFTREISSVEARLDSQENNIAKLEAENLRLWAAVDSKVGKVLLGAVGMIVLTGVVSVAAAEVIQALE